MKKGLWTGIWNKENQYEFSYIATSFTGKYRLCEKNGKILLQREMKDQRIGIGNIIKAERLRWETLKTVKGK